MKNYNPLLENRNFFIRFRGAKPDGREFGFFDYIQIPLKNIEPYLTFTYSQWMTAYNKRKLKQKLYIDPFYPSKCAGLWFNQLKPEFSNTHQHDKFDIPIISWIDIDLKTPEQKEHFKKELGDKNDFMDELETNPYVWLIGESQSGGIRIGFIVDYKGEATDPDTIYKLNQEFISEALRIEYGYNYRGDSSYADTCSNRISQPSFTLKWCVVNHNSLTIENTMNPKPQKNYVINYSCGNDNDLLLKSLQFHPTTELITLLSHWSATLGAIIKFSNNKDIWQNLMVKYYSGTNVTEHLKGYQDWVDWINTSCKTIKYQKNLKKVLGDIGYGKKIS